LFAPSASETPKFRFYGSANSLAGDAATQGVGVRGSLGVRGSAWGCVYDALVHLYIYDLLVHIQSHGRFCCRYAKLTLSVLLGGRVVFWCRWDANRSTGMNTLLAVCMRTGCLRPYPEYSRANSYPWSPAAEAGPSRTRSSKYECNITCGSEVGKLSGATGASVFSTERKYWGG